MMKQKNQNMRILWLVGVFLLAITDGNYSEPQSDSPIIIGVEYAAPGMAKAFAGLGVTAVKYYPDEITWKKMQPTKNSPLNFSAMDGFVREYQNAGFKELVITFKTKGSWAVKDDRRNFSPKPEHLDAYGTWVQSVVERYDMDGKDDMPGLRWPVRYFEVGSEFSSYEPEPVEDYITMLEVAYRAAHSASDDAVVMNAAFLATTAFKNKPSPEQYAVNFRAVDRRIMEHSLADIRQVLNRADILDAIDLHALGEPDEIEDMVNWLKYEMSHRGYKKPIVIGDTATSPFIAWGAATNCRGPRRQLGVIVPPATEQDRCRLAEYFQKLVNNDRKTVRWTQAHAASDMAKKVVVAANVGVALINTAFMEDLTLFKLKIFKASAGTSPWAGMALTNVKPGTGERIIKELRPSFYALKQLAAHLNGYSFVERIRVSDSRIRLYRFIKNNRPFWIAWLESAELILPDDPLPEVKLSLQVDSSTVTVESLLTEAGQTVPEALVVRTKDGVAEIILTPTPAFITK